MPLADQGGKQSDQDAKDRAAEAWLKAATEKLSEQFPMWSRSAYTHRRSTHVQFYNGNRHPEGAAIEQVACTAQEAAEKTLVAIRAYRATIDGPVLLTWRMEPEVTRPNGKLQLYVRLCFEPDIWADAPVC